MLIALNRTIRKMERRMARRGTIRERKLSLRRKRKRRWLIHRRSSRRVSLPLSLFCRVGEINGKVDGGDGICAMSLGEDEL